MFQHIRKSRISKVFMAFIAISILNSIIYPTASMALTSGPSQPEIQSFEPVGTTQMVDLFSGDFTYNIPLFDLPGPDGGYPFNLAYHSGISMDQEATWVGLGWTLNPGAINRSVRGYPDDFKGDKITKTLDIKANVTMGGTLGIDLELVGGSFSKFVEGAQKAAKDGAVSMSIKAYYNNYRGLGSAIGFGASYDKGGGTVGVGVETDSQNGSSASLKVGFTETEGNISDGAYAGISLHSSRGLTLSFGKTYGKSEGESEVSGSGGSSITFAERSFNPVLNSEYAGLNMYATIDIGGDIFGVNGDLRINGFYNIQDLKDSDPKKYMVFGYDNLEMPSHDDFKDNEDVKDERYLLDFTREKDNIITKNSPNIGIPSLTYDVYNIMGQGTGGMFRPYRSDFGAVHDPYAISETYGFSLGVDVDPPQQAGVAGQFSTDISFVRGWKNDGSMSNEGNILEKYQFIGAWDNRVTDDSNIDIAKYEPVYFKNRGELNVMRQKGDLTELDLIGGESPVGVDVIDGEVVPESLFGEDKDHPYYSRYHMGLDKTYGERVVRSTVISKFTNKELKLDKHSNEFTVDYFNSNDGKENDVDYYINQYNMRKLSDEGVTLPNGSDLDFVSYSRDNLTEHHTGAFSVVNPDGRKYMYALPAQNKSKKEYLFSANRYVNIVKGFKEKNLGSPLTIAAILKDRNLSDYRMDANFESKTMLRDYSYTEDGETKTGILYGQVVAPNDVDEFSGTDSELDRYFSKIETGSYAHSYLLTAVLGADYVDVTGDGPTDDDYGYWVKFNYVKKDDNYGWRAPYSDANYDPGMLSYGNDDKASFMYGEREQWYLGSVETKTHIAVFSLKKRNDAISSTEFCKTKLDGTMDNEGDRPSYRLDKIDLFTKLEFESGSPTPKPLKTINLEYDYLLCPEVENNSTLIDGISYDDDIWKDGSNTYTNGKLTLRSVYFTYEGNTKGSLSPYVFDYKSLNPSYSLDNYDRWGNYTEKGNSDKEIAREFPYVSQKDRSENDEWAQAWHLTDITLPSGGAIKVDYESDDYSHVQNKVATQMFTIDDLGNGNGIVYTTDWDRDSKDGNKTQRRIYFNLEERVLADASATSAFFKQRYLDGLARASVEKPDNNNDADNLKNVYQIYFKVKSELNKIFPKPIEEYVSGYANLDMDDASNYGFDADPNSLYNDGTNDYYTRGYVTLEPVKYEIKWGGIRYYHPFAAAAWSFIQNEKPDILTESPISLPSDATSSVVADIIATQIGTVMSSLEMFMDLTTIAFGRGIGRKIDNEHSVIRLCSPDRVKLGGGSRVKKITFSDNWDEMTSNQESSSEFGQVYTYTVHDDELGCEVSSGVATYEPMIGADENPLRWAKQFTEEVFFHSDNMRFFEFPVNESYYPGESVGYRKVTVQSLNSFNNLKNLGTSTPPNGRSTGYSEYEFYTCKDFPVMYHETDIDLVNSGTVPIILPFIGNITDADITASQGYSIILNDMHGKPKSVRNFAQPKIPGEPPHMINSTEYVYKTHTGFYDGSSVYKLDNKVDVLFDDIPKEFNGHPASISNSDGEFKSNYDTRTIGVEYEFFTDQRMSQSEGTQGGIDVNVSNFGIPTLVLPWPSIYNDDNALKLFTTNKIIHKAGILDHIKVTNEESVVTTKNELWDPNTGEVLLTSTQNSFDNNVYNYNIPAYQQHKPMGADYEYAGYQFKTYTEDFIALFRDEFGDSKGTYYSLDNSTLNLGLENFLNEGAEVLFMEKDNPEGKNGILKYLGYDEINKKYSFQGFGIQSRLSYDCKIISNNKNLLGAKQETIVSLSNPTNKKLKTDSVSLPGCSLDFTALNIEISRFVNQFYNEILTVVNDDEMHENELHVGLGEHFFSYLNESCQAHGWNTPYCDAENEVIEKMNPDKFKFLLDKYEDNVLYSYDPEHKYDYNYSFKLEYPTNGIYDIFNVADKEEGDINVTNILNTTDYPEINEKISKITIEIQKTDDFSSYLDDLRNTLYNKFQSEKDSYLQISNFNNSFDLSLFISFFYNKDALGDCMSEYADFVYLPISIEIPSPDGVVIPFIEDNTGNPFTVNQYDQLGTTEYSCFCNDFIQRVLLPYPSPTISLLNGLNSNYDILKLNYTYQNNSYTNDLSLLKSKISSPETYYTYLPYIENVLSGNTYNFDEDYNHQWRPKEIYTYNDERFSGISLPAGAVNTRDDGVYAGDDLGVHKFYQYNWNVTKNWLQSSNWFKEEEVTKYNEQGNAIESKNALGTYSSVLYGYKNYVPIMVANNAAYSRIFNANFEEIEGFTYKNATISSNAHTGESSLFTSSLSADFSYIVITPQKNLPPGQYILEFWIAKNGYEAYPSSTYKVSWHTEDNTIKVKQDNEFIPVTFNYSSNKIGIWQKVEATFNITKYSNISFYFGATPSDMNTCASNSGIFVDDVRLSPVGASVKSFVYDKSNYRLTAEMDENNFATLYYYDEAGNLYLVKKETEKGIVTLSESRKNLQSKQ